MLALETESVNVACVFAMLVGVDLTALSLIFFQQRRTRMVFQWMEIIQHGVDRLFSRMESGVCLLVLKYRKIQRTLIQQFIGIDRQNTTRQRLKMVVMLLAEKIPGIIASIHQRIPFR